jgi:hypothetical protein
MGGVHLIKKGFVLTVLILMIWIVTAASEIKIIITQPTAAPVPTWGNDLWKRKEEPENGQFFKKNLRY